VKFEVRIKELVANLPSSASPYPTPSSMMRRSFWVKDRLHPSRPTQPLRRNWQPADFR
jgi:hypothetical protein